MKTILFTLFLIWNVIIFSQSTVFSPVDSKVSGVDFSNNITETESVNIVEYDYLYNGGGIGIGDFNNDGLSDVFFSGNQVGDALFMNQGKFKFKKTTAEAGINKNGWSTGVCIFDVNQDGFDDIYICRSGWFKDKDSLKNVLYVNQKDGTFIEEAEKYGLDLSGHHIQAAPLDFDLDGDLDLYIIGHPGEFQHKTNFKTVITNIEQGNVESDVLLENRNGVYVDITREANIFEFGYSLGLAITDINQDGFPDIIVGNDYDEPDHAFINQKDGTFRDENTTYFKHTSNYTMGNDVGDVNNDGLLDYFSVDMAYNSHLRSKMNMSSMQPEKFKARTLVGWNQQYMHNMLQLNSGLNNYQEISKFSKVDATDWSWAPLFFDINADGYLDLFVSNGYKRDTKNNDIQNIINEELKVKNEITELEAIQLIPAVKVANFYFENNKDLTFTNRNVEWADNHKINSNGAAYADLDNDGDLDLILNNMDTLASIYENKIASESHYLVVDFKDAWKSELLGMKLKLTTTAGTQVREAYFTRGYQSSVEQKIHFFWGESEDAKSLEIMLNNGLKYYIELKKQDFTIYPNFDKLKPVANMNHLKKVPYFKETAVEHGLILNYVENETDDFKDESLLPHEMSKKGPALAVADINNDGLDDFVIGSSVGKIPYVILQHPNGTFGRMTPPSFFNHQMSEDGGIHIFDVNDDGKKDMMISSGGYQYSNGDTNYINRLYIGNGIGNFGYAYTALPKEYSNSGKVIPADFDMDGDLDFFVCGPAAPKKYPYPGKSTFLINENRYFKDKTNEWGPAIENIGMVNDADFSDLDEDGDLDLIIVGEWMDISIFENVNNQFVKVSNELESFGWWTEIHKVDIDGDGDDDFLLGNAGLNNKFNASKEKPLYIYANDFDDNGSLDIVLSFEMEGQQLPVRGRECSAGQMPFITEKFPTFLSFAQSNLMEIYGKEKLNEALSYRANEFRSGVLINNGGFEFEFKPFPAEAQFSFINDFTTLDINKDGKLDILAVGNRFSTEVETTRYDAGNGVCLIQGANGEFQYLSPKETGFFVPGEATVIEKIKLGGVNSGLGILVGNNSENMLLFEFK